uniref:uncharacterized protein n=1 Tax=Centroberyx gerrardi TaxID=166262 RepID=UPI003AAEAC6E
MSITPKPALGPDRDSLPLKKRDQRLGSPQPPSEVATFKAPYPYKSHNGLKTTHTGPFQPVPRRVPTLYQPWVQTHAPTRTKPHILSPFREHHGWAEWREFGPLHPGWDLPHHHHHHHHHRHHSHFFGHRREMAPPGLHPVAHLHHPSKFRPVSLVTEGFHGVGGGYRREATTFREESLNADRQTNGRSKGPYVKRIDRKMEHPHRGVKASPPSSSTCLSHSVMEELTPQEELMYKHQTTRTVKHPFSRPLIHSTSMRIKEGSLIELRDGRLRRVEDLQTEDFLLGSLACPDLRLSCCTVQSISLSASSSSLSRLLILLHDQHSQELVDVYVEYPFFVRGRGWSSCCPQRTARLCGLQCRQLSVGDVCLALTPVSPPQPPPSATLKPETSPRRSEGGCGPIKPPHPQAALRTQLPPAPDRPTGGQKKGAEPVRRRHWSAPELRAPGTNCV